MISASFSASHPFVSLGFFLQGFMFDFSLTFGSLIIYSLCRYQNLCVVWNPRQSDPLFVGEGFPLPPPSHSSFHIHFPFSISVIRNPPVTASLCHPPLGKEGFFWLPCVKGAPLQTVRNCFSFILNFPLFSCERGYRAPLAHTTRHFF